MKIIIYILLFITFSFSGQKEESNNQEASMIYKLRLIFTKLDSIIMSDIKQDTSILHNLKIFNKNFQNLKISVDTTNGLDILTGASFNIYEQDSPPILIINVQLLKVYDRYPSIVYSVIVHEMKHIADYFMIPNYELIIKNNKLEHLHYEIDALITEAIFIRDYLDGFNLSNYESFLLYCLEHDFSSPIVLFDQADLMIIRQMEQIRDDQELNSTKSMEKLMKLGQLIYSQVEISDTTQNFENYIDFIKIYTFSEYSNQIMVDIESKKNGIHTGLSDYYIRNYPKLIDIINKAVTKANAYLRFGKYRDDMIKWFNDI